VTAVALSFVETQVPAAAIDPEDLHELSKLVRRRTAEVVDRLGGCLAPAAGDRIIAGFGLTSPVRTTSAGRCARRSSCATRFPTPPPARPSAR
jgi:class 3 adenylate cyclase